MGINAEYMGSLKSATITRKRSTRNHKRDKNVNTKLKQNKTPVSTFLTCLKSKRDTPSTQPFFVIYNHPTQSIPENILKKFEYTDKLATSHAPDILENVRFVLNSVSIDLVESLIPRKSCILAFQRDVSGMNLLDHLDNLSITINVDRFIRRTAKTTSSVVITKNKNRQKLKPRKS